MYDPYENNYNNNDNGTKQDNAQNAAGSSYPSYTQPQQPTGNTSGWNTPAHYNPNNTQWQGGAYHSTPVYNAYQDPSRTPKPPKEKKPRGKAGKYIGRAVACLLAVCVISGGSVAGFVGLVNGGYVKINGGAADSAFQITRYLNADDSTQKATPAVTGELSLQDMAKKVIPSVVCVENYQEQQQQQSPFGYYFGNGESDNRGGQATDISPAAEGSGIIATSDGYIITNAHVVSGATKLGVILSDGTKHDATLVGSDSATDLAVIKIEAKGLTAAEFGSSGDMEVADTVMAIGNPGGSSLSSSVTIGYVSAVDRSITDSNGYTMKAIQTDAAINPGNSGGALVNMYGQVIGINSSKISATGYEGLGFAIPIDDAQPIISNLKQYGYVKDRAVIGITGVYLNAMNASMYGLTPGFYVQTVTNESATAAGLTKGCVINKIDGQDVTSQSVISNVVNAKKPGDKVTLAGINGLTGQEFSLTVTLAQNTGK